MESVPSRPRPITTHIIIYASLTRLRFNIQGHELHDVTTLDRSTKEPSLDKITPQARLCLADVPEPNFLNRQVGVALHYHEMAVHNFARRGRSSRKPWNTGDFCSRTVSSIGTSHELLRPTLSVRKFTCPNCPGPTSRNKQRDHGPQCRHCRCGEVSGRQANKQRFTVDISTSTTCAVIRSPTVVTSTRKMARVLSTEWMMMMMATIMLPFDCDLGGARYIKT